MLKRIKGKILVLMSVLSLSLLGSSMAFATGETPPAAIDTTSVFSSVTTSASGAITSILPYAAAILGAIFAIRIGMKIYKKVTGS